MVKMLDDFARDPSNLGAGVPRDQFMEYLSKMTFAKILKSKVMLNTKIYWDRKKIHQILSYCIEDHYIVEDANKTLKVSSSGEQLISPWYYPRKALSHSITQHSISVVAGALGMLLLQWLLTWREHIG